MRYVLFFILCLGTNPIVWAQGRASISGFVIDATSGETLLLATVRVAGTSSAAATNTSGYYRITGIPPGRYTVVASYLGYSDFLQEVTLEPGEKLRLDIEMQPASIEINEVVVTTDREGEDQRDLGVAMMEVESVKQLPAILEPDLFRALQLLPGIKAASDYSSGLYIRGGSPDQTLILLDRNTVYNPSHFFGFFSPFNPDAIKDVRLYKGGYPASYGGRLGSVLDIYNKDGNRNEVEGGLSIGMLASRAYVEGPYSKGSWMFAVRRSTIDPLLSALRDADVEGIPDLFYFYDINAKVNFDASRDDRFSLSVYSGKDRLVIPFLDDAEIAVALGNRTLSANWTHLFSDRVFSNFTVTASHYFSLPDFYVGGTVFRRSNNVYDLSAKGEFEYIPNERHQVKAGFWAGNFTMRLRDTFDDQEGLRSRIGSPYASVYLEDAYRPGSLVLLRGGVRANYFKQGNHLRLEPRLTVEYQPTEDVRLQAGYGRYYQFLSLITSQFLSAFDIWLTTAEGVDPSYGDQYILGAKTRLAGNVNLDVETYFRTMEQLFELDPFLPDVSGLDYDEIFHVGRGRAYGVELQLERPRGRLNGFIGYTLGRTERQYEQLNEGAFYPPKYDRTHDIKAVGIFELGRQWRVTGVWTYATGQTYTVPVGFYKLNGDPIQGRLQTVFDIKGFNNRRLPVYHRLDLGISKSGRLFKLADYEVQLQVINAYNRRNIWFYYLDVEDGDTVERTEIPQIPVPIPNVSFSLTF